MAVGGSTVIEGMVREEGAQGVTAPIGFRAAAMHCGVRKSRPDVAMLVSDRPTVAAGTFTQSRVRASNVDVCEAIVRDAGMARAIICVSGNANACTGDQGREDTLSVQNAAAAALGLAASEVLFAATGVIGEPLPVGRITPAMPQLCGRLSSQAGDAFAHAILTTDKRPKEGLRRIVVDGRTVTVGGAAKGSGMIHPNMATMLGFLTTDAAVEQKTLQAVLSRAVDRTFNRITVDQDTSTNDMALLLANGAAGNHPIGPNHPDLAAFAMAVEDLCRELARAIARDGEGATKLLTVHVHGALTEDEAADLARAVAGSSLVKSALFGADPNFGRVLAVLGRTSAAFAPEDLRFSIGGHTVFENGIPTGAEEAARQAMQEEEVLFDLYLGAGGAEAEAFGCDLSYEYVRINGSYRS